MRCPPLPQTLLEATNLIDQPEQLEVGPVTAMVQRDPIVVAKLLHIVNSAYYGLRRAINSVERAVVMRASLANKKGEQLLRRMGVKLVKPERPMRERKLAGDHSAEASQDVA